MEAATLNSPQRKLVVVPVQKSLSLPSYARAGGEGIDHRVIFAALEQREKIRRKSKIFTREKSARQNIFCLPISSGNKCRETSLSSDTSCSSLEYQKPKPKPKKDEKPQPPNEKPANELSTVAKTSHPEEKSNPSHENVAAAPQTNADSETQKNSLKFDYRKGHRSPSDTLRPNFNSSDSMERSSRSSNDSLSRRERLVAIKARVEAAREKYGDTSSEEENRNGISRYNSDGVIHRTVKEVKSRSHRLEKRLRRRSQDEYALKKTNRKNNLSLCLNSLEDGIKLDLDWALNIFEDGRNTECKTDFCPSPNLLDFTKKNYYSDFPSSKENMSRVVQARIKQIEEEERKRRNSVDLRDKSKSSSRQSPLNTENPSPFPTQVSSNQNAAGSLDMEKISPSSDVVPCPSPVGRAPTPPPRSPKSISFVNKVYKQHQNACLNHDSHSLERKTHYQPNIPLTSQTKCAEESSSKCDVPMTDSKKKLDFIDDAAERRKMRQLFNSRRKTCGFFDYTDNFAFKELNSTPDKSTPSKSTAVLCNYNIVQSDARGYNSGSDGPPGAAEDPKRRLWRTKWQETEKRQEFMFNSLESKKKPPSWFKEPKTPQQGEQCICQVTSGNKHCTCSLSRRHFGNKLCTSSSNKFESFSKNLSANGACRSSRLSKSELNIAYSDEAKANSYDIKLENLLREFRPSESKVENTGQVDKLSATANLDSAMEELESIYRSLKFSSDNLSEKNSASNISLNDLNADSPKKDVLTISDSHLKLSSSKENNNFNLYSSKSGNSKPGNDKRPLEFLKLSVYSPSSDIANSSSCRSPEAGNLCIDEMFNDLTRQLDIEQKLLKESRDRTPKSQNDSLNPVFQADPCHKSETKRMSPLESIVSIRKELYDNLQKSSQTHSRSFKVQSKDSNKSENADMSEKKHKAVRTLSENISYLMSSSYPKPIAKKIPADQTEFSNHNVETLDVGKTSPKHYEHENISYLVSSSYPKPIAKKIPTDKTEFPNHNVETLEIGKTSPKHYEHENISYLMSSSHPKPIAKKIPADKTEFPMETLDIGMTSPKQYEHRVLEPLKTETKNLKQPVVPKRAYLPENQKKLATEEIRQIRVSMDSETATAQGTNRSDYPRLTSVVRSSRLSSKSDATTRNACSVPKETDNVLDENGLEKLLNTLLHDVPEPKQSSLLMSREGTPPTPPPPSSGEMRVLQHLDILRLNPIPS